MYETYVRFEVGNGVIRLSQIYYIGSDVIIAAHPETGKACLFRRSGNLNTKDELTALAYCSLKLGKESTYKGVSYNELEVI